jgi:hypothetical protein
MLCNIVALFNDGAIKTLVVSRLEAQAIGKAQFAEAESLVFPSLGLDFSSPAFDSLSFGFGNPSATREL